MVEQELVHAIEAVLNSKKKISKAESKVTERPWSKTSYQHGIHGPQDSGSDRFEIFEFCLGLVLDLFGPLLIRFGPWIPQTTQPKTFTNSETSINILPPPRWFVLLLG